MDGILCFECDTPADGYSGFCETCNGGDEMFKGCKPNGHITVSEVRKMDQGRDVGLVGFFHCEGDWLKWTTFKGTASEGIEEMLFWRKAKPFLHWTLDN